MPRVGNTTACLVLAVMVGVAVWPRRAAGQAPGVVLEWSAPASCPDGESVRRRIEALAGPGVAVGARAVVAEAADGYRVSLEVRAGGLTGERKLTAATCDAAAESVAAIAALAATSWAPAPTPAPTHSSAVPIVAMPSPTSAAPGRKVPDFRAAFDAALDVGTLPSASPGAALTAELAFGRISAGISGALWQSRDGYLTGTTTQGAHFALQTYDAFGCYALFRSGPLDVSSCVALEIAWMTADGFGATTPQNSSAIWVAIGAGARVRLELGGHFALALGLAGVVPTIPQQFQIDGSPSGSVFSVAPAAARAEVGPELRF